MPMRTFSPMIDSTDTSMSLPIMMLWLDLRVRTNMVASLAPLNYGLKHALARDAIVCRASRHVAPAIFYSCRDPRSKSAFALGCGALMARRSLRPHLNQIRGWVRQ